VSQEMQRLCRICGGVFVPDDRFKFVSYQSNGQEIMLEKRDDGNGGFTEIAHLFLSAKRTATILRKRAAKIKIAKDRDV